jgi:hypothetical protein
MQRGQNVGTRMWTRTGIKAKADGMLLLCSEETDRRPTDRPQPHLPMLGVRGRNRTSHADVRAFDDRPRHRSGHVVNNAVVVEKAAERPPHIRGDGQAETATGGQAEAVRPHAARALPGEALAARGVRLSDMQGVLLRARASRGGVESRDNHVQLARPGVGGASVWDLPDGGHGAVLVKCRMAGAARNMWTSNDSTSQAGTGSANGMLWYGVVWNATTNTKKYML